MNTRTINSYCYAVISLSCSQSVNITCMLKWYDGGVHIVFHCALCCSQSNTYNNINTHSIPYQCLTFYVTNAQCYCVKYNNNNKKFKSKQKMNPSWMEHNIFVDMKMVDGVYLQIELSQIKMSIYMR